jgi:integrase
VKKAGLEGIHPHGLRHTAAGLLTQLGAHPKLIQQRMRHASIRTTFDVYGAVLPSLDDAVVKDLDKLIQPGGAENECGRDVGQTGGEGTA